VAATLNYAAVDLGAESGRVMLARCDDERLALEELHRFANVPVRVAGPQKDGGGTLHWDVLRLWDDIQHGLGAAARQSGGPLVSVGVDTWGLDFALLARDGELLGNPVHYRDARTQGMLDAAFERVPRAEIFEATGIQFMPINSLYQLLAMKLGGSALLDAAAHLLTMPDLFHYWLSGEQANEFSNATTTQCYDPRAGDWAWALLDRLGLPKHLFGPIIQPGTRLGPVRPALAAELGLGEAQVVAPAAHDTGSAVAAVPFDDPHAIYLSSGTWSLMGVELPHPIINAHSLAYNFTNEGGVGGTFRLLKNIMGLWVVQECRRAWATQGHDIGYPQLVDLAEAAPAFGPLAAMNDDRWLPPGDMPARLRAYFVETGQPAPESMGTLARCVLESLALEYRWVAERLDELTGRRAETIHIIGGGSQNALLNQFTADATGRAIIAGPVEATALGNVLVQAMAAGQLSSLAEGRALVRRSFPTRLFAPTAQGRWDEAYDRYVGLRPE